MLEENTNEKGEVVDEELIKGVCAATYAGQLAIFHVNHTPYIH